MTSNPDTPQCGSQHVQITLARADEAEARVRANLARTDLAAVKRRFEQLRDEADVQVTRCVRTPGCKDEEPMWTNIVRGWIRAIIELDKLIEQAGLKPTAQADDYRVEARKGMAEADAAVNRTLGTLGKIIAETEPPAQEKAE